MVAILIILAGLALALPAAWVLWPIAIRNAPYVATPPGAIRQALRLAEVKPGERVVDLGAGLGRVLRLAAWEFGAVGYGVELDPGRVWLARRLNRLGGLEGRIELEQGDMFTAPLGQADVVFLFLCPAAMGALAPKLRQELRPGSRIVSRGFVLPGWQPASQEGQCYLYRQDTGKSEVTL